MLFLYRILINLVLLISPIIIVIRLLKKKEDKQRFREKFCFFSKKRGSGKVLWFHGSSVGEILSIIPLIEKLEDDKSIKKILITSSTLSSSKVLSKYKLNKTIHQFFPLDSNFLTKKFLNYWKPSIAVFIESEIWPNMIINIKKKSIPLILLNARITEKSFKKWRLVPSLYKNLFKSFNICYPQNYETKKYLKSLGVKKIKLIGNLKFSESKKQKRSNLNKNINKIFRTRKIWCAASTHQNEELFCAKVHQKLKKKYKNLLTIIIPRHINRVSNINNELTDMGLKVKTHSQKSGINYNTEVYLVDTYGETKSFFKICKIVFLGGSIINRGGQNPLEPARLGCKILHGPNIQNFKEVYQLLSKNNLSSKFYNVNQLSNLISKSFTKKINFSKTIVNLKKIGSNTLNKTLREINLFL
ncbi:3-deoxy-D-manno-octulosonic acid transferase [Candidatus Pelagibacter sp.]|nr:3-deoxy-D-manno-octulosonic acid transferase [Candidatus Pelagibacter sp.]